MITRKVIKRPLRFVVFISFAVYLLATSHWFISVVLALYALGFIALDDEELVK